jgi:hypothetical protein
LDSEIVELISKSLKRVLDENDKESSGSKKTNPNRPGQKLFRERLIERDKTCPITGNSSDGCEAAHIVRYSFYRQNTV